MSDFPLRLFIRNSGIWFLKPSSTLYWIFHRCRCGNAARARDPSLPGRPALSISAKTPAGKTPAGKTPASAAASPPPPPPPPSSCARNFRLARRPRPATTTDVSLVLRAICWHESMTLVTVYDRSEKAGSPCPSPQLPESGGGGIYKQSAGWFNFVSGRVKKFGNAILIPRKKLDLDKNITQVVVSDTKPCNRLRAKNKIRTLTVKDCGL